MPTTPGSVACGGDGPNWSQLVFPKIFFRTRWNYVDRRKFSEQRLWTGRRGAALTVPNGAMNFRFICVLLG
jgi:hypothetical protein